jgi:hypothetical protein
VIVAPGDRGGLTQLAQHVVSGVADANLAATIRRDEHRRAHDQDDADVHKPLEVTE